MSDDKKTTTTSSVRILENLTAGALVVNRDDSQDNKTAPSLGQQIFGQGSKK